jgi:hypothetical protein
LRLDFHYLSVKIVNMKTKDPAAVALGSKGGKARAKALSPKRRSEIAKKAVTAREAKRNSK